MIPSPSPSAFFLDVDGCLIKHHCAGLTGQLQNHPEPLSGSTELLDYLNARSCKIILTTGRPESTRQETESQLKQLGFFWDELIMGLGNGPRYLVNDTKPDFPELKTAVAITVERNKGLKDMGVVPSDWKRSEKI